MIERGKLPAGDVNELLMALIDGELGKADAGRARAMLAGNPALAGVAETFQSTGRDVLGPMFDGILTQTVPGQLVHTVQITGLADRLAAPKRRPRTISWLGGWRLAFGGLAAAAVAISIGVLMLPGGKSRAVVSVAVAEGLSAVVAGAEDQINTSAGALKLKVVQSFKDGSGSICREYEAQAATGPREYGVACRGNGGWEQRALFSGDARSGNQIGSANQAPAQKLDSIAEKMISGDPLSADDEQKLIASGWKALP